MRRMDGNRSSDCCAIKMPVSMRWSVAANAIAPRPDPTVDRREAHDCFGLRTIARARHRNGDDEIAGAKAPVAELRADELQQSRSTLCT